MEEDNSARAMGNTGTVNNNSGLNNNQGVDGVAGMNNMSHINSKYQGGAVNHDKVNLGFKKVKGRREFFDLVKNYIIEEKQVTLVKLEAYLQYTTGASSASIHQALAVLENVGLIESEIINEATAIEDIIYRAKSEEVKP